MPELRISKELALPLELVTESVAILAVKRAGKSVTAKRLYEQLHRAGVQVGSVDPKGDWWGLRSSADGKHPGLPVLIIGGERGDVPLDPNSGELVAQLVVRERVSFVLDLSELSKGKVAVFMSAFLETLYRMKAKEEFRTPMHLIVDEADAIAPQQPHKGEERMLGAAEDIVRRGGQRGIGITLVTQRTAVLNKSVLTQCGILIMLRTSGSQDIDAIDYWIKKHGQPDKRALVMGEIATLPRGTAWVWAPAWPDERGIFKKAEILLNETFDSGATPKVGQKRATPKTVADVDLDAFRAAMAATIEKAKADDPKALRARIAELEKKLAAKPAAAPVAPPEPIHVLANGELDTLTNALGVIGEHAEGLASLVDALRDLGTDIRRELADVTRPRATVAPAPRRGATPPKSTRGRATGSGPALILPAGERAILTAIAQHDDGVTREQLTVLTGYKRSSRDTYLQRLRAAELFEQQGDRLHATGAGIAALGSDFEPLPTGDALREHWLERLGGGERTILAALIEAYPEAIDRTALDETTGYKRSSRDTYLQRLAVRRLITVEGRGEVRASATLFGGG